MRKTLCLFIILIYSQIALANMASPFISGSTGTTPFTSKYVDILDESMLIILNSEFNGAKFIVQYRISSDKEGIQIPLLFYAFDYFDDFKIWMDGKEIELKPLPEEYEHSNSQFFNDFDYFFKDTLKNSFENILLDTLENGFYVNLSEMKYFETDIKKGEHIIKVEYTVKEWIDKRNWINEYSIRYALSPAKYWKSFGNLKITLDASKCGNKITTNLGKPASGSLDSVANWNFSEMPVDIIQIDYNPEPNSISKVLINIGPASLAFGVFVLLLILHIVYMLRYRMKSIEKRFSWVMIVGSFVVPAISIISYILFYPMIDAIIGQHASNMHGYYFIIVLFYPFLAPIYLLIMWLIDRFYKRYLIQKMS